jgi:hypothetical protein
MSLTRTPFIFKWLDNHFAPSSSTVTTPARMSAASKEKAAFEAKP